MFRISYAFNSSRPQSGARYGADRMLFNTCWAIIINGGKANLSLWYLSNGWNRTIFVSFHVYFGFVEVFGNWNDFVCYFWSLVVPCYASIITLLIGLSRQIYNNDDWMNVFRHSNTEYHDPNRVGFNWF